MLKIKALILSITVLIFNDLSAQKAYFVKAGISIGDTSATIASAISRATNKDTIILMPGTYGNENINLNNLNNKKIYLTSLYSRDTTKRQFINTTILDGTTQTNNGFVYNSQNNGWGDSLIIIGIRIQNYTQMISNPSGLSYLKIEDCDLNNNGSTNGGFINFSNGITELIHNTLNNNSGTISLSHWNNLSPIQIKRNSFQNHTINSNNWMGGSGMINVSCCGSSKTVLENNLFYNIAGSSTGYVININSPSSDSTIIRNNTFFNNDINSIKIEGTSNICLIQNNLFNANNRNSSSEFSFSAGSKVKLRNNVTYSAWNKYTGFSTADTSNSGTNYIFQDLKFTTTYYPSSQSPFIGLGSEIGIANTDLDGKIRPNPIGSSPEIGAFETSFSLVIPKIESIEGTNGKVSISWVNNFGEKVKGVAVYRSTSSNITSSNFIGYVSAQTANTYIDSVAVTNGVLYHYSIKTVGSIQPVADSSAFSATVNVITAANTLSKPGNFKGSSSPARIRITWDNVPSSDTIKYNIYRANEANGAVSILTTKLVNNYFVDTTVSRGKTYKYKIKSIDRNNSASNFTDSILVSTLGKTWFVDNAGNDSDIGSEESPFKSIQTAINNCISGDSILLKKGIYKNTNPYTIDSSINITSYFLSKNDSSFLRETILDGSILTNNYSNGFTTGAYSSISLSGLTIQNISSRFHNEEYNYKKFIILDNILKNIGAGNMGNSFITTNTNSEIKRNEIYNFSSKFSIRGSTTVDGNCFWVDNSGYNYREIIEIASNNNSSAKQKYSITNNLFVYATSLIKINNTNVSDSILILNNNYIFKNINGSKTSISFGPGSYRAVLANNIFFPNDNLYFEPANPSSVHLYFNNNFLNSPIATNANILNFNLKDTTGNIIGGNPGFASAENNEYKLTSTSKLLGQGTLERMASKDIDNKNRPFPQNSKPDIGAFENIFSLPSPIIKSIEGGDKKLNINFDIPFKDNLDSFYLYRSGPNVDQTLLSTVPYKRISKDSLSIVDLSNINNKDRYYYRMKAKDLNGNLSDTSNLGIGRANISPEIVVNVKGFKSPSLIKLEWGHVDSSSFTYNIYRGISSNTKTLIASGIKSTEFIDTSAKKGISYYYAVKAIDSVGAASEFCPDLIIASGGHKWTVDVKATSSGIGSIERPFSEITKALKYVTANDTISLKPGVYKESLSVKVRPIVITSEIGNTTSNIDSIIQNTIIDGSLLGTSKNMLIDSSSTSNMNFNTLLGLSFNNASNYVFNNLTRYNFYKCQFNKNQSGNGVFGGSFLVFDSCKFINNGPSNYACCGNVATFNDSVIIRNSYFTGNNSGSNPIFNFSNNNSARSYAHVIEKNMFILNGSLNINSSSHLISMNGSNGLIQNNIFTNNTVPSIRINANDWSNSTINSNDITNNTIIGNKSDGIRLDAYGRGNIRVTNNIIQSNATDVNINGSNMGNNNPVKTLFSNNIIGIGNSNYALKAIPRIESFDTTGSTLNFSAAFEFTDTLKRDYSLSPYSKALGNGNNTLSGINNDYYGNFRPNPIGSKMDLGAIESKFAINSPSLESVEGGNKKALLQWSNLDNTSLLKYYIYRSTTEIVDNSNLNPIDSVSASTLSYVDSSNLINLTKYFYRIKAGNTQFLKSSYSNSISVRPNKPLSPPINLQYQSAPRRIKITWSDTTGKASSFTIFKGKSKNSITIYKTGIKTTFFNDSIIEKNSNYYYFVKAVDSVGAVSDSSSNILAMNAGNIFYVDKSNSINGIGSTNDPINSIQGAINMAIKGDTILVRAGIYKERLSVDSSITIASMFIVSKDTADIGKTIINGSEINNFTSLVGPKNNMSYMYDTSGIKLIGLRFEQFSGSLYSTSSRPIIVSNCNLNNISSNCNSIIAGGTNSIVEKSIFNNCSGQINLGTNSTISQNRFNQQNVSCNGQLINASNSRLKVYSNIFNNTNLVDVYLSGSDSNFVINNTFYKSGVNSNSFIRFDSYSSSRNYVYNNIFNRSIGNDFQFNMVYNGDSSTSLVDISYNFINTELTNIVNYKNYKKKSRNNYIGFSPSFNNLTSGDFSLSKSSRAIGVGIDTLFVPKNDFYSQNRPLPTGSKPDLGAIESIIGIPAPQITSISAIDKKISISWKIIDTSSILKYRVYKSSIDSLPTTLYFESATANVTSIFDSTVEYGNKYNYRVQSVKRDLSTSDYSDPVNVTIYDRPILNNPNNNAKSVAFSDTLKWSTISSKVVYKLQSSKSEDFSTIDSITLQTNSFPLDKFKLIQNTNYYWRVSVKDSNSSSLWSNIFKFQTRINPAIISDTNYISEKNIRLTVNYDSSRIKSMKIYKGLTIESIKLYDSLDKKYLYNDTLNYGRTVYYGVTLINTDNVESGISNLMKISTYGEPTLINPTNNQKGISLKPSFSWSSDTISNKKEIQITNDSTFKSFANGFNLQLTKNNYDVIDSTKILPNTNYYWRIRVGDKNGFGPWSVVGNFQTFVEKPIFNIIKPGNKVDTLNWSLRGDSLRYKKTYIYRDTSAIPSVLIDSVNGSIASYIDRKNLEINKKYYYRLRVVNTEGAISDYSSTLSATPFNRKPVARGLMDKTHSNVGFFNKVRIAQSSVNCFDPDGRIEKLKWYVNDSLVNNTDSVFIHYYSQGTSKVKLVIEDDDGAKDSTYSTISLTAMSQKFKGGILGGITALNPDVIYTADSTFDPVNGSSIVKLDKLGNTTFSLVVSSKIFTTPSVSSDSSVFITSGSSLNGFDKTGSPLWSTIPLGGLSQVTPTIDSVLSRIYVGVSNKNFFAVDYKTGKIAWNLICDAPINASAIITGDRKLVFVSQNGTLYGFDIKTNIVQTTPKWQFNLGETISKSAAVDLNNSLYFGTNSGKVIKIDLLANGTVQQKWTTPLSADAIECSPVLDGNGFVYIGTNKGKFIKLNPNNGSIIWTHQSSGSIKSTPSVTDYGNIVFATSEGKVVSIDTTNAVRWQYESNSPITANLLSINNMVYAGTHSGQYFAIYDNPNTNTVNPSLSFNFNQNKLINNKVSLCSIGKMPLSVFNIITAYDKSQLSDPGLKPTLKPVWGTFQGDYKRTGSRTLDCPTKPNINVQGSQTICQGDSIKLTTNSNINSSWVFNNVQSNISDTIAYVKQSGTYKRINYNDNGCNVYSNELNLLVKDSPDKPVVSANGNTTVCQGTTIQLSSTSNTANTWFKEGSNVIIGTNQGFVADSSGKYYVKVTSSNGCVSTSEMLSITINKNPSVPILTSSATQICSGDSTSISAEGNLSKQWYNGTNMINGAVGKVYTAKSSGFYSLVVTDQNGCKNNSASVEVVVKPSTEKPTLIPSGSKSFCSGSSVTLNSTVNAGNIWYKDSLVIAGSNGPSITVTEPGIYHVTSQRAGYCLSAADTIKINVTKAIKPTLTILGPGSVCIGDSVILSASTNSNQWYKDGLILVGSNASTLAVKNSGTYSVISNVNGCLSDTASKTISFNNSPNSPTIIVNGSTTICSGEKIVLTSSITNADDYLWKLNGNTITGMTASTLTAGTPGVYSLAVKINGCYSAPSESKNVVVTPNPTAPVISANGPLVFCAGGNVQLSSTSLNGNQWLLNGTPIPGANLSNFTATTSGNYSAIVTNNGCSSSSDKINITINQNPSVPTLTTTANQICSGDSTSISTESNLNKQWFIGTNMINDATGKTYKVKSSGFYSLVVTDQNGCKNSSPSIEIVLKPSTEKPTLIPSGSKTICEGSSITLNSTVNAGNIWYKDNVIIPSANGASITVSQPGSYHVSSQRAGYCVNTADTIKINVIKAIKPILTSTGPTTLCIGDSVVLSASTNGNQWYKDGLILAGSNGSTFSAKTNGTYTVISTINGCQSDTASKSISFNAIPVSPVINTNRSLTICSGEKIIFSSSVTNADGYLWKLNGNTITSVTSPTLTAEATGFYSLAIRVNGCFSAPSETKNLIVNPIPNTPVINANGPLVFCAGGNVILTSNSPIGNQWMLNDAVIPGANSSSYTASSTGNYSLIVIKDGCSSKSSSTITTTLNLQSAPVKAEINTSSFTGSKICFKDSIIFISKNQYDKYYWSTGDTTKSIVAKKTDTISLRGTYNGNPCYSEISDKIVVIKNLNPVPVISILGKSLVSTTSNYYRWTQNNVIVNGVFGYNYINPSPGVYKVETSLDNYCWDTSDDHVVLLNNSSTFNTDSVDIKAYPNPSTDGKFNVDVYFSKSTTVLSKITITDMQGVIIQQTQKVLFTGKHLKIPVNMGINKGSYAVHVDLNGTIKTVLMIID